MKRTTDSNTVVTRIAVPYEDYLYKPIGESFANVSAKWFNEPWIKYLYQYGEILHAETYKDAADFSTVHVLTWSIDSKKKVILLLQWAEQLDKIYR